MRTLHDHFHTRNQQAFQRLLDGSAERAHGRSGPSTSAAISKSWSRPSSLTSGMACNVNARDYRGRTVLHLACAAPDGLEYVRLLLRHPSINVNLPDTESHWTPLHRTLYNGNIPAALLLLQREDTDRSLQDLEGYSAFDLYNSTLEGTKPVAGALHAELYTWGANRNAALGLGDAGDRVHPDQVVIQKKDDNMEKRKLSSRFSPLHVRQIQMSKLHTAVVTCEPEGNLRLCGFGSGGRLGPGQHTQYTLKPLPHFTHTIISVALGQDHTLALTKTGEVFSWGLNRFSQLGYVLDTPAGRESFGRIEEPIQSTPRKVQAALRKVVVRGIAAARGASACWTDHDVYTWGTNNGQLGYPKTSEPQILPRIASWVTQPVLSITLAESVMACLVATQDVICIWNDRHVKVNFPVHGFPAGMQPHRPRQTIQGDKIAKITSCDDLLVALSVRGELFTFSAPNSGDVSSTPGREKSGFKPQRVWALRKSFSAVKDVALGSEGSIIVCTESGHVLTRSRITRSGQNVSGKTFKFQRLSQFQRVTQVCANSTGAFAALRMEYQPKPIEVRGNSFGEDLATIQPYLTASLVKGHRGRAVLSSYADLLGGSFHHHDDDTDDFNVEIDIRRLLDLFDVLDRRNGKTDQHLVFTPAFSIAHGADVMLYLPSGEVFPCHRIILAARSRLFCAVLGGSQVITNELHKIYLRRVHPAVVLESSHRVTHLSLAGCQPISILIFLTFLYSDDLLAIWDRRIAAVLEDRTRALRSDPHQIKADLRALADVFELPTLTFALKSPSKRHPDPSLSVAMQELFQTAQISGRNDPSRSGLAPDIVLKLADRDVFCHSEILRARSLFFASFFEEEDWTVKRWNDNILTINMKYLDWRVMEYVLSFMCWGAEDIFDTLDFATSVDDVLEFVFDVMAVATELLLDRLVLLCSATILQHVNLYNACYILVEASHLFAEQLIERIQSFLAINMELLLDTGMLVDIPPTLVKQLAGYIRAKQEEKSPVTRSGRLTNDAMARHAEWLAMRSVPSPVSQFLDEEFTTLPQTPSKVRRKASRLSRDGPPHSSPSLRPHKAIRRPPSNDDIFAMDDADVSATLTANDVQTMHPVSEPADVGGPSPVWKATRVPRVDMKTVMAEAANKTPPRLPLQKALSDASLARPQSRHDLRRGLRPIESMEAGPSSRPTSAHQPPPSTPPSSRTLPHSISSSPATKPSTTTPTRTSSSMPGLGPLIAPARQATSSASSPGPSIRRALGKAWNQPTVTAPAPSAAGMSLVAIQQFELDQVADGLNKEKRSLREIQEEEKEHRQEADFLAWWTAEEERVKLATEMSSRAREAKPPKRPKQGPRKKAGHPDAEQEANFLAWWTAEEQRVRLETEVATMPRESRLAIGDKVRANSRPCD